MMKSYADAAQADSYLYGRKEFDKWQNLSNFEKAQLLEYASLKIDSLKLTGRKTNKLQSREFPRNGDKRIPIEIKYACVDEAFAVLNDTNEKRRELISAGVKSFSIGDLSETYGVNNSQSILLSENSRMLLSKYLGGGYSVI